MKILLSKYSWYSNGHINVTGYIRTGEYYLQDARLAEYFSNITSAAEFKARLLNAAGQFAVVLVKGDEVWMATDKLRSVPLYYCKGDEVMASDSAYSLFNEITDPEINEEEVSTFISMGYTLNNTLLVRDIFQVVGGSYVILGKESQNDFYHISSTGNIYERGFDTCSTELAGKLEEIFRAHFTALMDKFIVIPLSAGYDSRFIALMCKKYHPQNVLCYTYGREDNPEFAHAGEVAGRLGFQWVRIVYNDDLIKGFVDDPVFHQYYKYASGLGSMFFMQEYFAVKYLKENDLIPADSVFVPGHAGNIIGGEHLIPALKTRIKTMDDLTGEILRIFSGLLKLTAREKRHIRSRIAENTALEDYKMWTVFENWDIKERQSKFIVNSAAVYPFFGYQYIIPYWDGELIDFFSRVPFDYKLNKKVYNHTLINTFFAAAGLNFDRELYLTPAQVKRVKIRKRIKKLLPSFMISPFLNFKHLVFYDGISKLLTEDQGRKKFRTPPESNNFNSYLTQWYVIKTREALAERRS